MNLALTDKQQALLTTLAEYDRPPSTRQLLDRLDRPRFGARHYTIDEVGSSVRRLERRGYVRRAQPGEAGQRAVRWELTEAGRSALAAATAA